MRVITIIYRFYFTEISDQIHESDAQITLSLFYVRKEGGPWRVNDLLGSCSQWGRQPV